MKLMVNYMELKFYNTLTKQKDIFEPINADEVKFYSCGPTVYNFAHIGNLRTYIFNDLLKRTLKYNGYNVNHVMNITDVGHLTDDADSGEDKMEKGAKREGKTVWEIAEHYANAFKSDLKKLNIIPPTHWPKATDSIQEMIDIVKKLEANGFTYEACGNIYFDTVKFNGYKDFARLRLDDLESRTGIDENKKNPTDFVLWFGLGSSKFGDSHSMKWESPWGIGYPGWHIECTAMSCKFLGEQFDIHTGGIDHINVHHTNEVAQAECAFGVKPWVKYWMHANFLVLNKGKMSKSGDGFLTLAVVEGKGFDPVVYRYFCLGTHYRKELNFSWEALDSSKNGFERMKARVIELKDLINSKTITGSIEDVSEYETKFMEAVSDDLNTPVALAVFLDVLNNSELNLNVKYDLLKKFDSVLGLDIDSFEKEQIDLTSEELSMIDERNSARQTKNWARADEIRDYFKAKGLKIVDNKNGKSTVESI